VLREMVFSRGSPSQELFSSGNKIYKLNQMNEKEIDNLHRWKRK